MPEHLNSAIYIGRVRHRRLAPVDHAFSFPLFMVYLDLQELDEVFSRSRFWSARRRAPARMRRSDYIAPHELEIGQAVRERVQSATGDPPRGPIRMLTHLRYFGYCFNPVTFYYCWDQQDQRVETVVAEITNTPWKERHAYVLHPTMDAANAAGRRRFHFPKTFHVSPFMPMDIEYDWTFSDPADRLFIHMNLRQPGESKVFDATLNMDRHALTPARMNACLLRFPLMTMQVIARIHIEALRLWLKRSPVHPHPKNAERPSGPAAS